jgi:hypothetical protein
MLNPNLCNHEMKFATVMQRTGTLRPKDYAVLYCTKCGKIFTREIKIK